MRKFYDAHPQPNPFFLILDKVNVITLMRIRIDCTCQLMNMAPKLLDFCVLHLAEGRLLLIAQAALQLVAIPGGYTEDRKLLLLLA